MAQIPAGAFSSFGVGWRLSSVSGWGVYGLNLSLQLFRKGREPVLLLPPHRLVLDSWQGHRLAPAFRRQHHLLEVLQKGGIDVLELDYPVLHALRNGIQPALSEQAFHGAGNAGVIFFEDTALDADAVARARDYDVIVTGSSWNRDVLAAAGVDRVANVFQGIEPALFHPAPGPDLFPGRFVVFSGGKLEFRKGQDLVVAAFRRFRERHDDAVLVFAWANQWAESVATIAASPHTEGAPETEDGETAIASWLIDNGLPPDSFMDLGMPPNGQMAGMLRDADVALFPNRCEPGTNLVAMECMATGVPVILSANTGHLDLIAGDTCYPLASQGPVAPTAGCAGTDGWGESDVDEAVEALEAAYADRDGATRRAEAGRQHVLGMTWDNQVDKLLEVLDDHFVS
jgi:glycosyltransferase involved in cell wall biosynthesis